MAADCLHGAQSVPGPRSLNSPPSSAHGTKIALRGPGWFICRGSRTWHQKCPKISFGVSTPRSSSLGVVLKNRGDLLPSRSLRGRRSGGLSARVNGAFGDGLQPLHQKDTWQRAQVWHRVETITIFRVLLPFQALSIRRLRVPSCGNPQEQRPLLGVWPRSGIARGCQVLP